MASLGEVADGLSQAAAKADQAAAAFGEARQLVLDARTLITGATEGARGLEAEADQVGAAWDHVIRGCEETIDRLARLHSKIDGQIRSVVGPASPAAVIPASPAGSAVPDQVWIERQLRQLPDYITSGVHRDEDGDTDVVQSGQELGGEHRDIADHLRNEGFPPGGVGGVTIGEHVEGKVAWRLRNSGERSLNWLSTT